MPFYSAYSGQLITGRNVNKIKVSDNVSLRARFNFNRKNLTGKKKIHRKKSGDQGFLWLDLTSDKGFTEYRECLAGRIWKFLTNS